MSQTRTVARPAAGQRSAPPPPDDGRAARSNRPTGDGWASEHRTPNAVQAEVAAFMRSLDDERKALREQLPSDVDMETFVNAAKIAVTLNTDLLMPNYRMSLFIALQKAARQGLMPDGKQGALIVRYDSQLKRNAVCWQPMVWGMAMLGRRTGDIRTFTAQIVYQNEPFRILQGDEDRYEHERIPECEARGLAAAIGAYAIITGRDGAKTRRWMGAARIRTVKASSKAANGPWNGPFEDEMWIKTILLFTMKWVNTDKATNVFKEAVGDLQDSLEVDLDAAGMERRGPVIDSTGAPSAPRGSRLDQIETKLDERRTAKAPAAATPALTHEQRGPDPLAGLNRSAPPEHIPLEGEAVAGASVRRAAPAAPRVTGKQAASPARSAGQSEFRVFVRDFDGAPSNEGRPVMSAMELVRWLDFQLTQLTGAQRDQLFRENRDAIELAHNTSEDAARALYELTGNTDASPSDKADAVPEKATAADAKAAAEDVKAHKWADDMISEQIKPAATLEALNRATASSQAFVIRVGRYDKEHPAAAAKLRQAYEAKLKELKGGAQ